MREETSDRSPDRETTSLPFDQVVALCQAYSGEWDSAARPRIGPYLERVALGEKETLLRNLLQYEIRKRRLLGDLPQTDEYLEQLPQYASLIRKVFLESTSAGSSLQGDGAATEDVAPLAATRLGDYRLLREIGRGGMGLVYEAVHVFRGNRVALKLLPQVDGSRLFRFKREFRSAAGFSHPNLIGLHSLEADGAQWFFTMDLIEGADFLDYVRPFGELDLARLRSSLSQLALGVMALHRNHIIHRDLKPSNVMVTHDGRVILLDFGLVVELEQPGLTQSTDKIAGTPAYMAPEQATGTTVTAACDWYAVGVMLYEALSGNRPFNGSLWEVLRQKQNDDPPPLPALAGIPNDLAVLCMRLLAREPHERPDAFEIAKHISTYLPSQGPAATATTGRILVGRDHHLAALRDVYRCLQQQGDPQTVFIRGRSGEGKTTLAEAFLAAVRADKHSVVMSGRCYDRESVPFKALDSLIDALASYLRSVPETDAALLLPDDIGALAQVFPVLGRVDVVARATSVRLATIEPQQVRQRAFAALRSLLLRISRRSPVIWLIDDLQWGDADSAEVLFEALRPPEGPRVLFLGTYRSDEAEGSAFLNRWKELQREHDVHFLEREVNLAPLSVEECTEVVIGLLGKDNESVRRRAVEFSRETRGNPFLLTELIGCFDPETDSFEPLPLHEVLCRKLGRLPDEAGHLLDVVAVSGQALPLEEASRTAGHAVLPMATLTRMRNERLIRLVGTDLDPVVDTYHDRVRETILGELSPEKCQTIHRALAEVIEAKFGAAADELQAGFESWNADGEHTTTPIPRVFDLAYHFDAAGEQRKAWIYALVAGEQARLQSALEVAANNFAAARRNADATNSAVRYRISEGHGAALLLMGRYEDAAVQLEGTIELTDDPERKARIEALRGEIRFKQGSMHGSAALFESGLRRLGRRVPRTTLGFLVGFLRESGIQCVHTLLPGRLHRNAADTGRALVVRLFNRAIQPYLFGNTFKMLWSHVCAMNSAELQPPSGDLAFTHAIHGMLMSMLGWQARGSRYGERAMALARQFDDLYVNGQCCNYYGVGRYATARYEEGLARLNEAIHAFEKAGDPWELNVAHFHKGCCHFGLGNLGEAVAEARSTFASSARIGDSRALCSSYLWARATRGNLPYEELKSCCPNRPDDIMSTVHGLMAEGHWHTFGGRTAESLRVFERAADLVRKSYCVNSHMIVVVPELAGALRRHAGALQAKGPLQAGQLRRRATSVAKWATRLCWLFPAAYPLALRERSLILAECGKTRKALKFADKSCAVAEAQKAKYEHAQSLLVRGEIARQLGLPEADEQVCRAEAAIEAIERPLRAATGPTSGHGATSTNGAHLIGR